MRTSFPSLATTIESPAAKAASRDAVAQAFAAGLSIVVAKGGKLVRIAPDGTETVLEDA